MNYAHSDTDCLIQIFLTFFDWHVAAILLDWSVSSGNRWGQGVEESQSNANTRVTCKWLIFTLRQCKMCIVMTPFLIRNIPPQRLGYTLMAFFHSVLLIFVCFCLSLPLSLAWCALAWRDQTHTYGSGVGSVYDVFLRTKAILVTCSHASHGEGEALGDFRLAAALPASHALFLSLYVFLMLRSLPPFSQNNLTMSEPSSQLWWFDGALWERFRMSFRLKTTEWISTKVNAGIKT